MTETLLKELKQLDDKIILTEVFMLESRAAHAVQNMPRAKVSIHRTRRKEGELKRRCRPH